MQSASDDALRAQCAGAMRQLANWAVKPASRALPEDVRRRAAAILMDDLGAMLAGAVEPPVADSVARLLRASGPAEASVFAPGTPRADRATAAAANGMAATWCELDEGFRGAPCHAGAYLLPALLAEAEATGVRVADVLAALAIAYEITTRLARAFPAPVLKVHPHAGFATIGAAAAVSALRGHDAATLLAAVTGATSMAFAGPYGHAIEGALVRNAWTAAGAWIGLQAADWAEAGIGGLAETPYDVFAVSFGNGAVPALLSRGLGEEWAVRNGYHKMFACCQYAHSAVEATLALRARLPAPDAIGMLEEIRIETHPLGLTLATTVPATVLAAKFSMPHAAAAAARLGTGGRHAFSTASLVDADIAALRQRVRLVPFSAVRAPPHDRPARVTWRFGSGEEWSETCLSARGGADRPFDEAILRDKFADNAGNLFPAMLPALDAILAGDPATLARPWRQAVATMTDSGQGGA
jgi:2-methylcitrate dehydratase PrpD